MSNNIDQLVIGIEPSDMEKNTKNTWQSSDELHEIIFESHTAVEDRVTFIRLRMPKDLVAGEYNLADSIFSKSLCVFEFLLSKRPSTSLSGTLSITKLDFTKGSERFSGSFKLKAHFENYPGIFAVECKSFEFTKYGDWTK